MSTQCPEQLPLQPSSQHDGKANAQGPKKASRQKKWVSFVLMQIHVCEGCDLPYLAGQVFV